MADAPAKVPHVLVALAAIQSELAKVGKSGRFKGGKVEYPYTNLEDIREAVHPHLVKHGLLLSHPVDAVETLADRQTREGGTIYAVRVRGSARLHSSKDGSMFECPGYADAQASDATAVLKATTGMRRYTSMCLFGIASSDDPELFDPASCLGPPRTGRPVAKPERGDLTPGQLLCETVRRWSGCDASAVLQTTEAWLQVLGLGGRKLTDAEKLAAMEYAEQLAAQGVAWPQAVGGHVDILFSVPEADPGGEAAQQAPAAAPSPAKGAPVAGTPVKAAPPASRPDLVTEPIDDERAAAMADLDF